MAKKAEITITDHNTEGICTLYYSLRLKLDSESTWTALANQFESPIVLNNLEDDENYDLEVTRHCCTGTSSEPTVYSFTSTNT